MKDLLAIFWRLLRAHRWAMIRGGGLSFVVLFMGAALLGLSGWFIVAAAAAGLAGVGAMFDVFRPSALVRFLALGRAAGRYGERLLTHDATLRGLEHLRADILRSFLGASFGRMTRIRGAQALNRLTADVDALDGVSLRLFLPVMAALATHLVVYLGLHWLLGGQIAAWISLGYVLGGGLILSVAARLAAQGATARERASQDFRSALIDMIRARRDLAVYGRLPEQAARVGGAEIRQAAGAQGQDAAERRVGVLLNLLTQGIAAGALGLGVAAVSAGDFAPAFASLGFFAALGLAETLAPLRRLAPDLGRMRMAAHRVRVQIGVPAADPVRPAGGAPVARTGPRVVLERVSIARPGTRLPVVRDLSLTAAQGETVALTAPSGGGKSTVLLALAGLLPVASGEMRLNGTAIATLDEAALRASVVLVPQRSALIAGTLEDNLRLGCETITPEDMQAALRACALERVSVARGGLQMRIGARGEGLSGGEARRVALARAILRRPEVLLLDEPTEGLDQKTAAEVLKGIRDYLLHSTIIMASHRQSEVVFADKTVKIETGI
ncbi:ATP-binding cassette domain-containing protein [Thioclava litoralis]|uniref:ATP-binding cassette domain-containing protein n=1 Tax=Thioclava litoralis TaxID=3076557 RepID=A0ABZ1DYZ9_9RHOB|nr:ATP-binding cassette domain-containing protein [Thioclava sp. FTW29]